MPDDSPERTWPEGWEPIHDTQGKGFEAELARELAPGHELFGMPLRAIGWRAGFDDVVFEFTDGTGRIVVTHLTWKCDREPPPWPDAAILPNFAAWVEYDSQFE
jgi:hypothetical protein